jgi:uncharacterized protein YoxC
MEIPRRYLNLDLVEIEPVTPLGMGNPTIAQAASQQLMQMRGAYDPSAQQEILHEATLVITQDPRKAARWAPLGKVKDTTSGEEYVQGVFGTLMQGLPVKPPERISPIEQVDAMLPLFAGKIALIERRDNVGKPDEVQGLQTVYQYLIGMVKRLEQDPEEKQRVKQYMDAIGNLWNQVKGLAQRGQEAAKKAGQANGNGGMDPKLMVQAAHVQRMAQIKEQAAQRKAASSEKQRNQQFVLDQRRKDAEAFSGMQREELKAKAAAKTKMKAFQE